MKLRILFHGQSTMIPLREIAGEAIGTFLLGGSLAALLFVRVLEPLMCPACGTCDCTTPNNLPTGEKSP
jgi:hypothetical protein